MHTHARSPRRFTSRERHLHDCRYQFTRNVLGKGICGPVYKAKVKGTKDYVAIKAMRYKTQQGTHSQHAGLATSNSQPPPIAATPITISTEKDAALTEIYVLRKIAAETTHPCLMRIYDAYLDEAKKTM